MKFKNFYDGMVILTGYVVKYDEEEVYGFGGVAVVELSAETTRMDEERLLALGWRRHPGHSSKLWFAGQHHPATDAENPALCECRECGKDLGIKDALNLLAGGPICDACIKERCDANQAEYDESSQEAGQ